MRFSIWVENAGTRDADRASVRVLIAPSDGDAAIQIHRDWFPEVPAGRRVGFEISARLPRGDVIVHVNAQAGETNLKDNETTVVLGLELVPGQAP